MSNNPFSLAVLRGHFSIATAILEIAQAQWAPKDEEKARYTMANNDDDEDSYESEVESDDEPEIHKEVIKDQLTIDNIGQVSTQVKSDVLPATFIHWSVPTFTLLPGGKIKRSKKIENLLAFAIAENDMERFKFLVEVEMPYISQMPVPGEAPDSFYTFSEDRFRDAVKYGRTEMLADAIKRAGAGIPLEDLVKKSGVEMKVKPRYYQGLTVYGKKRADWANRGRNLVVKSTGTKEPPLLIAALEGSLESVEWFISDTPMRHYLEFGSSKVAKEDPRLKHLTQAAGGFDRAIMKWLGVQNDLIIHCAVMGPPGEKTNRLIEYLIKVCPASLEARSDRGYTPLYLACLLGRVQFVETLIRAGADQSVKDKDSNNLIHAALANIPCTEHSTSALRSLLSLLDPALRDEMFRQRNQLTHGGDTPLHAWLKRANYEAPNYYGQRPSYSTKPENKDNLRVLNAVLELSAGGTGAELDGLNGAGDTILHSAVMLELPAQVRVLIERSPALLHRENAVGRTPAEIARDRCVASKLDALAVDEASRATVTKSPNRVEDLRDREPEWFKTHYGNSDNGPKRQPSRRELVWEVIEECLVAKDEDGTIKRRLVSLNEANDVARRIGESYTGQRYYQKNNDAAAAADDDEGDEEENKTRQQQPQETDFATIQYEKKKHTAWAKECDNDDDDDDDDDEAGSNVSLCVGCGQYHE